MKSVPMQEMSKVLEVSVIIEGSKSDEVKWLKENLMKFGTQDMDTYFNICCSLTLKWLNLESEVFGETDEYAYITEYFNNEKLLIEALKAVDTDKI